MVCSNERAECVRTVLTENNIQQMNGRYCVEWKQTCVVAFVVVYCDICEVPVSLPHPLFDAFSWMESMCFICNSFFCRLPIVIVWLSVRFMFCLFRVLHTPINGCDYNYDRYTIVLHMDIAIFIAPEHPFNRNSLHSLSLLFTPLVQRDFYA